MKKILLAFALLALSACQETNPPPKIGMISFADKPTYSINVGRIDVVDEYKSPMAAPNIEHLMPYSPSVAMHIWVHDRLRSTGHEKYLQVVIKDASVIATDLPKKSGIEGFFTNEQDKSYDAKLEVELRIYGDEPMSEANVTVSAHRSVTIDEKASAAKRENVMRQLVDDLMGDINLELDQNIPMYFGSYLNYASR